MDMQGVKTQFDLPLKNLVAGFGASGVKEAHPPEGQDPSLKNARAEGEGDRSFEKEEREALPKVIEGINTVLEKSGSHIRFIEHKASQRMIVEVLDDRTGDVIRTIPSKEMLDLAAKIGEMVGIMVDHRT